MKHPDHYDTDAATSRRMAKVHLKDGPVEQAVAKRLYHHGLRYRKNWKSLPGSPDIAILRYDVAVFIDGEFWHGKDWGIRKQRLKRNKDYWIEKIEENMARDYHNDQKLISLGWTPLHFWSKDVQKDPDGCVSDILDLIIEMQAGNYD